VQKIATPRARLERFRKTTTGESSFI